MVVDLPEIKYILWFRGTFRWTSRPDFEESEVLHPYCGIISRVSGIGREGRKEKHIEMTSLPILGVE